MHLVPTKHTVVRYRALQETAMADKMELRGPISSYKVMFTVQTRQCTSPRGPGKIARPSAANNTLRNFLYAIKVALVERLTLQGRG